MALAVVAVMLSWIVAGVVPPTHAAESPPSALASDETIILFPSRAVRESNGESGEWVVHLRGWVFEREEDSRWRNAAIDKLGEEMGLTKDEISSDRFRDRARSFLADNERGKRIGIKVGGRSVVMPETSEDGHFAGQIRLSDTELFAATAERGVDKKDRKPRTLQLTIENAAAAEVIAGSVRIVEPQGVLVVCDIDDTIKVSHIGDRAKLLRATFVEPFVAVPGMNELCAKLASAGAEFHYLSASPWQLYEPLAAFLRDNGFPEGCITLREFRMKDERIVNLFKSPSEYKLAELSRLAAQMPERRFVLIGDSTEHDAELYAEFADANPGRVLLIAIRATPVDRAGRERAEAALKELPLGVQSVVFEDPASVNLELSPAASPK